MVDEGDPVAVRWGSEAHRLFGDDWIEDFYQERVPGGPVRHIPLGVKPPVRQLTYDIVQSICFSSQMLEEDAIQLSQELARSNRDSDCLVSRSSLMSLVASIGASIGIYFAPWKSNVRMAAMCLTLSVPVSYLSVMFTSKMLSKARFDRFLKVNGLIMLRMYSAYKNVSSCKTVLDSKKRDFAASTGAMLPSDFFYFAQAEHALSAAIQNLGCITQELVELTHDNVVKIIKAGSMEKTPEILAYLSGDFLSNFDSLDSNIFSLRDRYYAFISQMLLLIGMNLLDRSSNFSPIMKIIEVSLPKYERLTKSLQFKLEDPPDVPNSTMTKRSNFELSNWGAWLSKFNSRVVSVWTESFSLENFIEEQRQNDGALRPEAAAFIQTRLSVIDRLLEDASTTFCETLKLMSATSKKGGEPSLQAPSECQQSAGDASCTVVPVGRSDFSVADEDQVFVSLERRDEDERHELGSDVDDDQEETPQYPPGLVRELKGALEGKRVEFSQRELEALKRTCPPGYAEPLCPREEVLPIQSSNKKRYTFEDADGPFHPVSGISDFETQKNISASVAAICKNLRLCETETLSCSDDDENPEDKL